MDRETHDIKPLLLLLFLNIFGIVVLIINENEASHDLAVLSTVMCMVSIIAYVLITKLRLGDPYLFVIVSMLSSVGIIMVSQLNSGVGKKQLIWYIVGVLAFFLVMWLYKFLNRYLKKLTVLYYLGAVMLFVATLLFGTRINGAKNWLFGVQPSEFIRILYVMSLASVFSDSKDLGIGRLGNKYKKAHPEIMRPKYFKWAKLLIAAFIAGSCAMFLLLQKELGTLIVFGFVYIIYIYVYGNSKTFLALNILAVVGAALFAVTFFDHVQERVIGWRDPLGTYQDEGFQVSLALMAVASGGFMGRGIGNGLPGNLYALESDSIFVVICEELGLMGGIAVLMLYFLLVYRGFKIALRTTNLFNKAVSVGLSAIIGIQTFIIVGGITNLIPLTGITLPFISAGGSSMVSTLMIVGILQAISSMKGETADELE